jgi:threonine dehydratase
MLSSRADLSIADVGREQISYADVVEASLRLGGRVKRTGLRTVGESGPKVKCENRQRSGSFKFRGAVNALEVLTPSAVVTASSGNHALALAYAAKASPTVVTVTAVMQCSAPIHKQQVARCAGIEVLLVDGDVDDRNAFAASVASERGAVLIPSSDHAAVISGQGTVVLEILDQDPDVEWIFVPVGGGGLAAGAILAAAQRPGVRIIGVEPDGADDASRSFREKRRIRTENARTICDGVRHVELAELARPIIMGGIFDIVTVPDEAVMAAQAILQSVGVSAEPTGALAYAGALFAGRRNSVAIVTGGNTAERLTQLKARV